MKHKFIFVMVLAVAVALIAAPVVFAARDNIASRNTACPGFDPCFGSIVADRTEVFAGGFSVTVESEVWFNPTLAGTGMYTYFYALSGVSGTSVPVNEFEVAGNWQPRDPAENWGVVTSETSAGVWLDPEPIAIVYTGALFVFFSDSSTTASGGLHAGEAITFYAQSRRPPALFFARATTDDDFVNGNAFVPTITQQVPEPASVALLGSALVGILALSAGARRRKTLVAA